MANRPAYLDAILLLWTAIDLWLTNIVLFRLIYWRLDRDGPEARAHPVAGAFNHKDTKMIIGDAYGRLDEITAKTNTVKIRAAGEECAGGCHGAA